jgi:transposase
MSSLLAYWLGIDVAKLKLDVALLNGKGKLKSKVFPNDPAGLRSLAAWLIERGAGPAECHVCMEATGPYSEVPATTLADGGWPVSVVNPLRVKGYSQSQLQRNKTDSADAALLAQFCKLHTPELWVAPTPPVRQLRALVDRLQVLKDISQAESNRLQLHLGNAVLTASIQAHLDWLESCIKALQKQIDDHIDAHPDLAKDAALLASIPGLGAVTVAKVLGYLGDVRRFDSAKALSAFLGVTPKRKESGSSLKGRSSLSRAGHTEMRKALYMPALVALRHNPLVKTFGERIKLTGLAPKAVVGACMHKLAMLIYGVLRSGQPFDVDFQKKRLAIQDGI